MTQRRRERIGILGGTLNPIHLGHLLIAQDALEAARLDRVRAFVKIQDGCSFSCNFCVIPLVRGRSRSRAVAAVLEEVRRRVAQGHREIVLTGINLGCYRDRDAGYALPRLVREVGSISGLERLRLSSIEVNHVDSELEAALRETPIVSRLLHDYNQLYVLDRSAAIARTVADFNVWASRAERQGSVTSGDANELRLALGLPPVPIK